MHSIDAVGSQLGAILAEARNFVLDIVLQQVSESLPVATGKLAQFSFEELLVKNVVNADAASGGLGTVGRTNASACSADLALAQLYLEHEKRKVHGRDRKSWEGRESREGSAHLDLL